MKRVAIITSSDMGYQGKREDLSGPAIREIVEKEGYQVVLMEILPDDRAMLAKRMAEIADENQSELILTTGGTGFSPRDVMPEATEDITKMAAVAPSEKTYFETSSFAHAKRRIPWLLVLMFSSIITGSIITKYENAFAAIPLLVSFIPMLMDTGGNSGSQSSTLIIRGLALGEITTKDIFKVIFKEFKVSIVVASILSSVNFLRLYFFTSAGFMVSLTVCASLFFTIVLAKVVGGILPIISKKLNLDPAIMASPLIYNNSRCLCINCLLCFCKTTFRNIIVIKSCL